jgi:dihydroxyacetone kinase DhaKLM complex PTS-EIIA-like component DhaM
MGVMTCPCKCILGIINGVILLAGLALSAAGGLLVAISSNPSLAKTLQDLIDKILKSISIIPGTGNNTNPVSEEFVELIQPAGIVILAISILGYCGLTCYTVILKVYVVVLIVILLIEVAVVAVLFSGVFNEQIQTEMKKIIKKHYGGLEDKSLYSVIPNLLMIKFRCCGIEDYMDFYNATNWNRTTLIVVGGQNTMVDLETPIACCKTTGTFPDVDVVDDYCAVSPNNVTSNYMTGCWGAISDEISGARTAIILVSIAVMLVQLAFIIVNIVIICLD